jgi:hypothetical protein
MKIRSNEVGTPMKTNCKLCWGITAFLIIGVLGVGSWFFIQGNVTESDDGRTAILLTASERDFVLAEMRGLLEAVEMITSELSETNMEGVAAAAKSVGMGSSGGEPLTLIAKLPLEFKKLGMGTHRAFDDLAMEAEDIGDSTVVLGKLSTILSRCTTCHAGYRFDVSD